MRVLISLMILMSCALDVCASDPQQSPPVRLKIDLAQMGYRPTDPVYYNDKQVFRNLTLLMQDDHRRLSFVSENELAVST